MFTWRRYFPGLALTGLIVAGAQFAVQHFGLAHYGLGPLTLAIAFGVLLGNVMPHLPQGRAHPGVHFAQTRLLRAGVALYGFQLSIQQIASIGAVGIGIDVIMVCSTLLFGWLIGIYVFRMDRETALLTAAGSAICGAAAVVATAPVLRMSEANEAKNTSTAVATVVLFGTAAIVLYPALYAWLGIDRSSFGIYIGSTVHEVAQVVAIGNILGSEAEHAAVITKMIRVMLLVPFLLTASFFFRRKSASADSKITIPWFAVMFLVCTGIHSLRILPNSVVLFLQQTGTVMLTAAMAALGLNTNISHLRKGGLQAFGLGLVLFAYLVIGGGLVNYWLR